VKYYYAVAWRYKDKFSCKPGRRNCEIRLPLAMNMNTTAPLDVTPCNLVDRCNCFRGTACHHFKTDEGGSRFL